MLQLTVTEKYCDQHLCQAVGRGDRGCPGVVSAGPAMLPTMFQHDQSKFNYGLFLMFLH